MSDTYDIQDIRNIQIQLDALQMEFVRLRHIEDRAKEKLEQLESLANDSASSGVSNEEREAYCRALKFVLQRG